MLYKFTSEKILNNFNNKDVILRFHLIPISQIKIKKIKSIHLLPKGPAVNDTVRCVQRPGRRLGGGEDCPAVRVLALHGNLPIERKIEWTLHQLFFFKKRQKNQKIFIGGMELASNTPHMSMGCAAKFPSKLPLPCPTNASVWGLSRNSPHGVCIGLGGLLDT